MDFDRLKVLPLHKHPEHIKECCDLINAEWPRSEMARMMSLQASCDTLPTSLILTNGKNVIGHCKLTPIPNIPNSCFIETVVISKKLRGMRLGTFLMNKVEEHCRNILKLKMLHLSTKGQEDFYSKLGYTLCDPISIYGTRIVRVNGSHIEEKSVPVLSKCVVIKSEDAVRPPPPPPPPMPKFENPTNSNIKSNKTFMFKYIS